MVSEFLVRLGTFSILIGLGVFMLFVASDSAGKANFDYLFWALLAIIVGILLRGRQEPAGAERSIWPPAAISESASQSSRPKMTETKVTFPARGDLQIRAATATSSTRPGSRT